MEALYNLREAAQMLGWRDWRTVRLWMHRVGIMPASHPHDRRHQLLTVEQIERIRVYHAEQRREGQPVRADLVAQLTDRIAALEARVRALEGRERPLPRLVVSDTFPPLPARVAPLTRKLSQGDAPEGWQPVPWWVRDLHKVPLITLQKAIAKGKAEVEITHARYRWRGNTYVENWLMPDAQAAFHRAFRHRPALGDPCRACGWSSSSAVVEED